MIKAYGRARDIERVRELWAEMRRRNVRPTSITLGCMVDALVCNSQPEEALRLVEEVRDDESMRDILNTVIYSTLLKGYCMDGDIDKGFAVLKDMTSRGKHEPDEILYNSLLDGCAKQHRVDDALGLIESMAKNNVRPSNFTLSILVKLLGRARRLNQAFQTVEDMCKRFDLQANIHVYTCLIYACFQNRQLPRALKLHDSMITEGGVEPDAKTYAVLARGCVQAGSLDKASNVIRAAYGLSPRDLVQPKNAPGLEARALEECMAALSTAPNAEKLAVPLLTDLKALGVHVERSSAAPDPAG